MIQEDEGEKEEEEEEERQRAENRRWFLFYADGFFTWYICIGLDWVRAMGLTGSESPDLTWMVSEQ